MPMSVVYTTVNGKILCENRGGVVSHFVSDPLGSVVMVRDTSGNTVYEAEYDPYGNVQSETGTNPSEFGYVGTLGYVKDSAFSLYVRARYLLTHLGRWLTKDPLWPSEPGFVYVGAQPTVWGDPGGLQPKLGKPIKIIPHKVPRITPCPAVHHDRSRDTNPCGCPLNWFDLGTHYGYVFIDCSCKGRDMGILPEECPGGPPGCDVIDPAPQCGKWIPADAIQVDGMVFKVYGQTCVVVSCHNGGAFSFSPCCRLASALFGWCHPKPSDKFDDRRLGRTNHVPCVEGRVR